jgi:hypothetical protein
MFHAVGKKTQTKVEKKMKTEKNVGPSVFPSEGLKDHFIS